MSMLNTHEQRAEERARRRERKRRTRMRVSGKSVFALRRIVTKPRRRKRTSRLSAR